MQNYTSQSITDLASLRMFSNNWAAHILTHHGAGILPVMKALILLMAVVLVGIGSSGCATPGGFLDKLNFPTRAMTDKEKAEYQRTGKLPGER